jgi:peptidoglycan hydrolase CwlO-like protein
MSLPLQLSGRTRVGIAAAAVVAVAFAGLAPSASVRADTAAEQREVKRQRAEVAGQIDTLQASDAQVSQALADLDANVRATRAQVADAQRAVDAAEAEAAQAERDARATEARIDELQGQVVAAAVDAYVRPGADQVLSLFQEDSANEASTKQALLDVTNGDKLDAVDELAAAKRLLEDQRDEAEAARAEAEGRRRSLSEKAAGFEAAQAEQQRVAAQISDRLSDRLAESQSLAALDATLASRIASEQAAIAAQLAAARQAAPTSSSSGSAGGGGGGPVTVIPRPGGLTTVGGITVAGSIASNVAGLLDAARADGFSFSGTGYRDSSAQIALRRQHCGTSDYAIYQMPPDQCSPPTAIPGRSKHEQGLAIDFAVNGRIIQSRSDPGFQWLAANAGRWGFVNLPSEPWHWSVDGS